MIPLQVSPIEQELIVSQGETVLWRSIVRPGVASVHVGRKSGTVFLDGVAIGTVTVGIFTRNETVQRTVVPTSAVETAPDDLSPSDKLAAGYSPVNVNGKIQWQRPSATR